MGRVVAVAFGSEKLQAVYLGRVTSIQSAANGMLHASSVDTFKKKLISTENIYEERPQTSTEDDKYPLHRIITPPLNVFLTGKGGKWEFQDFEHFKPYARLMSVPRNLQLLYTTYLCQKYNNEDEPLLVATV